MKARIEMNSSGFNVLSMLYKNEYCRVYKIQPMTQTTADLYELKMEDYMIRIPSETDNG